MGKQKEMNWWKEHINPSHYPKYTCTGWLALAVLLICIWGLNGCVSPPGPSDFSPDQLHWLQRNLK